MRARGWWGKESLPGVQKPSEAPFSCQSPSHHPGNRISWQQALAGAPAFSSLGSRTPPAPFWTHASTAILSSYVRKLNSTQCNYKMPFKSHSGCLWGGRNQWGQRTSPGPWLPGSPCAASQHPTTNRPMAIEVTASFRSTSTTPS